MPVIDIHNHFFPRTWPDLAERYGTPNWPWIKHTEPGKAEIMVGDRFFRHIYSACWDVQVRLEEMDRDGVDVQVLSATPVLFAYERSAEHALDCAKLFNDAALEQQFLDRLGRALTATDLWATLETTWVCLDCELMPWSANTFSTTVWKSPLS